MIFIATARPEQRIGSIALKRGATTTFRLMDQNVDVGGAGEVDVTLRSS